MKNLNFMNSSVYIKITLLLIAIVVFTIAGCRESGDPSTYSDADKIVSSARKLEPAITGAPLLCENGMASISGYVEDSETGRGVANVKVGVGECITATNAQGFYEIQNISESDRAVITFNRKGYYTNSAIIRIEQFLKNTGALSSNYLKYAIGTYDLQDIYRADEAKILVTTANANVTFPASIYANAAGYPYNGKVIANITYEDVFTDKGRKGFPGVYKGKSDDGTITPFVSYGFMVIELLDENGNRLELTDNAVIVFPSVERAVAENIPLWYYDYPHGIWIEEGLAIRQSDGTYRGEISHPGTWGLNEVLESASGIYSGRITYENGSAAKNVRVYAVGPNWIRADLSTDENGYFKIEDIPEDSFYLKACDYKYRYEARYKDENDNDILIPPVSSDMDNGG